jgi:hypothetical protein
MSNLELIRSYWSAEHAKDMDGVLSWYAEDSQITTPDGQSEGLKEIRAFYQSVFDGYEEVLVTITNAIEQGNEIAVEYGLKLVKHGGEVRMTRGCNVFTIKGEKIRHLRCYFNPADF